MTHGTSATVAAATRRACPNRSRGDPLETFWKNCVFDLCGGKNVQRRTFTVVVTSTPQQRAAWLAEVRETVNNFFPGIDVNWQPSVS